MLRLAPMTRDAWSMSRLHVELRGVLALAAHDNRLGVGHCLSMTTCQYWLPLIVTFFTLYRLPLCRTNSRGHVWM